MRNGCNICKNIKINTFDEGCVESKYDGVEQPLKLKDRTRLILNVYF